MDDNKGTEKKSGALLLIDSHALIHRAYHAIPTDLVSPEGEPTKAVFGFVSTILKVLKDVQPRYVAAAFDVGKSFRAEQFAEYKATRPKLADDLRPQIQRSREFCEAFGVPVYSAEGFEADDLIGALAKQASAQGIQTVILTGDTDTLQLVDAHTNVLMFIGRTGDMGNYDAERVRERYGLEPSQLIDLKALRGDASDNIPGVTGIGDKTATKLLQDYQNVEGIYEHRGELDKRTREKLEAAEEQVKLSKQLVTIERDSPATLDLEKARIDDYNREAVIELFRKLGFQSLVARLPETERTTEAAVPNRENEPETEYHTILTEEDLAALARKIKKAKRFVVDVETTELDPLKAELVGIAVGLGEGEAYYIPLGHHAAPAAAIEKPSGKARAARETPQPSLFGEASTILITKSDTPPLAEQLSIGEVVNGLGGIFSDPKIEKIAHNSKYDWSILERAGFAFKGLSFDTLIAAHLLEPPGQKVGLKELAFSKFGVQMTEIEALIGKGKNQLSMSEVSVEQSAQYACADADYTYRLYDAYHAQLKEHGVAKLFYDLEMPLIPVIVELEGAGVLLDVPALAKLSEELAARLGELESEVYAQVGAPFNLGSPAQLSDALFVKLGLASTGLERTRTGQISTAAGVLDGLRDQHPVIDLILEHRELSKLKGTYADALPQLISEKDGRVHTSFNQIGAVTGRISSSNPNLQNIPVRTELGRRVRRAFIAPAGEMLLSADYSQVELRILAHVSKDPNFLDAFARGEDIHARTAATLFNVPLEEVTPSMRRLGKTINFGVAYGISDWGVSGRTELSLEDSRKLIHDYYERYPLVKEYLERTKQQARDKGFVESLMGRRRYFPELSGERRIPIGMKNQAEREAINMPIQATAADIIKKAMVNLFQELHARKLKSRLILQVHDELVLECPTGEIAKVAPMVRNIMEQAYKLDAPLQVDVKVGANWDEMKAVNGE